jgi:ribonuclease HI
VYGHGTGTKLSFLLGQYISAFQAEVYAIKACAADNTDKGYKNRNIHILSDSLEAIKALDNYQINLKWVWDCHQSLAKLAEHNRFQLVRVPGYKGIIDNETVNQWARMGS